MPTLTLPLFAALLIAAVQFCLAFVVCVGRPQSLALKLRGWRGVVLLGGCLCSWLLLLDYSEWKEGYATRGYERRMILVDEYSIFVEDQLAAVSHDLSNDDCASRISAAQERYSLLSDQLEKASGTALPNVELKAAVGSNTACQRLKDFLLKSRLTVLQNELNHDFDRGVGTYFADRLFDSD
jgi:hypothetical protein